GSRERAMASRADWTPTIFSRVSGRPDTRDLKSRGLMDGTALLFFRTASMALPRGDSVRITGQKNSGLRSKLARRKTVSSSHLRRSLGSVASSLARLKRLLATRSVWECFEECAFTECLGI